MLRAFAKTVIYAGLRLWPDYMLDKAARGDMWSRVRHLRSQGFAPLQIVDVGAYDGLWARRVREIFPKAHILMIEPLNDKAEQLRAVTSKLGNATYCSALVAAEPGRKVIFYQHETASSLFRFPTAMSPTAVEKSTTTLDTILTEHNIQKVDFLKLDIQGAELDALKGGTRALNTAAVVLLELSVDDTYVGAPHASDVIAFMRDQGFTFRDLADVKRLHRSDAVHQFDCFFVRKNSPVYNRV
jgi:FkbM family methyltransferase